MAFAIMATDSKQLYLISYDHRTKKRKDFGCPSSLFLSYLADDVMVHLRFTLNVLPLILRLYRYCQWNKMLFRLVVRITIAIKVIYTIFFHFSI